MSAPKSGDPYFHNLIDLHGAPPSADTYLSALNTAWRREDRDAVLSVINALLETNGGGDLHRIAKEKFGSPYHVVASGPFGRLGHHVADALGVREKGNADWFAAISSAERHGDGFYWRLHDTFVEALRHFPPTATLPGWTGTRRRGRPSDAALLMREDIKPGSSEGHAAAATAAASRTRPLLTGRRVSLRDLEAEFGPCAGMVLSYGEDEFGSDGKLRWCAAMLPKNGAARFIQRRRDEGRQDPFLIGMGSFKRAEQHGNVGRALYGFALVADASLPARDLLWPDQLQRWAAQEGGDGFPWPDGMPFLRAWFCERPMPFVELTGTQPRFRQNHGTRVVPLDEVVPGLARAALEVPLRAAVLDRPKPLPSALTAPVEVREGALRYRLTGERERDAAVVKDALHGNRLRYGALTCEDCGYRPADDVRVPRGYARGMLDVHHVEHLARGERVSRQDHLRVLCPTCHRRTHLRQRIADRGEKACALPAAAAERPGGGVAGIVHTTAPASAAAGGVAAFCHDTGT